jgi:uncharacterized protein YndB with AHSA1/START domain
MTGDRFHYVTYIRTTAEKLWQALLEPEFTKQYWCGTWQECDWKVGSKWTVYAPDGRIADNGEVVEIVPNKKLVLTWQNHLKKEMEAEGHSRLTYELEQQGDMVRLTLTHTIEKTGSLLIGAVSQGWPAILSSLKSMLETGESLVATRVWPKGI